MVEITRKEFEEHCKENQVTSLQLEKLMWLADPELQKALKDIVINQQSMTNVGRRALKIIGYISAVIGLLYLMLQVVKEIKKY